MRQARSRLVKRGLIRLVMREGGKRSYVLTEKGKLCAEEIMNDAPGNPETRRWDGKWRIVIFDIWEKRRVKRDALRRILKRNGFSRLQSSVWVTPYDCEEMISFVRAEHTLGRSLVYIIADEIENDGALRVCYKLPLRNG